MKITLLGALGLLAFAALIIFVAHQLSQSGQQNQPLPPESRPTT